MYLPQRNLIGKWDWLKWLLLLAASPAALGDDDNTEVFSRAPYMQQMSSTDVRIVWRTVERTEPSIRVGTTLDALAVLVPSEAIVVRRVARDRRDLEAADASPRPLHTGPRGTRQFEAKVSDLKPDTRYYYAIYDGETRLTPEDESYHFQTSPPPGVERPAHFWVVGDSGTGDKKQSNVHKAMLRHVEDAKRPLDFVLHMGDMAYENGTDEQFQKKYFDVYEDTLRNTVVWPAMGNHEGRTANGANGVGPYFDAYVCPTNGEAGGVGSGTEAYYSFDYGSIHFVVLDSFDVDRNGQGAMARWLRDDLEQVKADWLVAYWHHPPYTKGSQDSDAAKESIEMREQILPILESHGVDVVLTGHSHIYERSMLMDGAYSTPTTVENVILDDGDGDAAGDGAYRKLPDLKPNQGTVQVVAGNGGEEIERMATMTVMKRVIVENGSVLITINGNVLESVMVNAEGDVRDRFQIVKQPDVIVAPVKNPRVLPLYVPPGGLVPEHYVAIIEEQEDWQYMVSSDNPPGWPISELTGDGVKGRMPFGTGSGGLKTELNELGDPGNRLYLWKAFELPAGVDPKELGLAVRYRDGFAGYVNGHEIIRHGVEADGIAQHEISERFEYFPLTKAHEHLREGTNVIAIEAHPRHPSPWPSYVFNAFVVERLLAQKNTGEIMPWLGQTVVPLGAEWRYSLKQEFEPDWAAATFDDSEWSLGGTPMSYGFRGVSPVKLNNMKDNYTRVRLRRKVQIESAEDINALGMSIGWDDGFIAYVNGHELGRGNVGRGAGSSAVGIGKTSRPLVRFFPLARIKEHVKVGENLIAIEGHNNSLGSSDYYIAPEMVRPWVDLGQAQPKDLEVMIGSKARWSFLAGSEPIEDWTTSAELGDKWEQGSVPLGNGYKNVGTMLRGMKGKYQRVYARRTFSLKDDRDRRGMGLMLACDDSCIVYVNGKEILRLGVTSGKGSDAKGIYQAYFPRYSYYSLEGFEDAFRVGENILAIEGHNRRLDSDDFLLAPVLVRRKQHAESHPMPEKFDEIVEKNASWDYLAGADPADDWKDVGAELTDWKSGVAGFGYGDNDDKTELKEMEGKYASIYVRREFDLPNPEDSSGLGLALRWDDGFIVYLNGEEILRENIRRGEGKEATGIASVDARAEYVGFPLDDYKHLMRVGLNVIAIEGHNRAKESSDFTLDPFVFRASGWPDRTQ
jgi:hypothetical protein